MANHLHLPRDVIDNILLRLPVNSILRFKCVSTLWFSLITDPLFIQAQVDHANRLNNFTIMLLSNDNDNSDGRDCFAHYKTSVYAVDINTSDQTEDVKMKIDHCKTKPLRWITILGSCNGIVCIKSPMSIFLWNPFTKETKQLPKIDLKSWQSSNAVYGFGYDPTNNDYKVFRTDYVSREHYDYDSRISTDPYFEIRVYTLRTNSWKMINTTVPHQFEEIRRGWRYLNNNSGVYVSGALHWLTKHPSTYLFCFDLRAEVFKDMPQPDFISNGSHLGIGVLGGCLCIINNDFSEICCSADIWVMGEYGVESSWTRQYKFCTGLENANGCLIPMCLTKTGKIVLVKDDKELHLYDITQEMSQVIPFSEVPIWLGKPFVAVVQSLVSLKSGMDVERSKSKGNEEKKTVNEGKEKEWRRAFTRTKKKSSSLPVDTCGKGIYGR